MTQVIEKDDVKEKRKGILNTYLKEQIMSSGTDMISLENLSAIDEWEDLITLLERADERYGREICDKKQTAVSERMKHILPKVMEGKDLDDLAFMYKQAPEILKGMIIKKAKVLLSKIHSFKKVMFSHKEQPAEFQEIMEQRGGEILSNEHNYTKLYATGEDARFAIEKSLIRDQMNKILSEVDDFGELCSMCESFSASEDEIIKRLKEVIAGYNNISEVHPDLFRYIDNGTLSDLLKPVTTKMCQRLLLDQDNPDN